MTRTELASYIDKALDGLKDFQTASVDTLYKRLYGDNRSRMLLADEVGLGKTIVARGLIARILKTRMDEGKRSPFRVTYICSNQVIAGENFRKLSPFPENVATRSSVRRIAYLAWAPKQSNRPQEQNLLEINTLTPSTSFEVDSGAGNRWERRIIYAILHRDLKMRNRQHGLRWIMMGTVKKTDRYISELDRHINDNFREDLPNQFIERIKSKDVPRDCGAIYEHLPGDHDHSLYDATIVFADKVDGRTRNTFWNGCQQLCRMLRREMLDCCISYVDADLYILDEFQRFRSLVDENSDDEQAKIARRVFRQRQSSRVLLLSATPFKAFTGDDDIERGEDHYKDLNRVLEFLLKGEPEKLAHYHTHRQHLHRQILDVARGDLMSLSGEHRDEVESILRSIICRTERNSVSVDPNALIRDVWKCETLPFRHGDIENFRLTDRLALTLERLDCPVIAPIEYCKSAPFPMSFLDRYKIREHLDTRRKDPEMLSAIRTAKSAWLNLKKIDSYQWKPLSDDGGPSNARLNMLLDKTIGPKGANLLWVPPSLPYYKLEDAFEGTEGFSKTLIFSSWIMVPRMIATLVSYEVERRTIGSPRSREEQESEPRRYFTAPGKKRHPVPQLRYSRKSQDGTKYLANMSNFTLLYPSRFLERLVDPLMNLHDNLSLHELRKRTAEKIHKALDSLPHKDFIDPERPSDRWYWAAPLLLDRNSAEAVEAVQSWSDNLGTWVENAENENDEEETSRVKRDHLEFLFSCFEDPANIQLGRMPKDLPEVLADLALGSPAVIALRTLARHFPGDALDVQLLRAFKIAEQFLSLFNKPESIAAIRLSEERAHYWAMVADYCTSGCLQSVIDEYFHLLVGQNPNSEKASSQLLSAINLTAATINVDSLDSFMKGASARKMRCHYAVEFGSQKIDNDRGQKRASSIRELFNSPFRPFVLATTSIGQEGLDFHFYCRRIVHWNLPGNPIDIEQREGRVNRFKGLVIRHQLVSKFGTMLKAISLSEKCDPWQVLFEIADREDRVKTGKCELVPYWHIESGEEFKIERIVPIYPFSIEGQRLIRILRTLAIYRLAFGQPRQAELVDHLLQHKFDPSELESIQSNLLINLTPITYAK